MSRVAVVTGANKGIGFAIVKSLCKSFDGVVYLTARDEVRGKAAVEELNKQDCRPKFHQLDMTDQTSVNKLASYLKDTYGGLDVLVNNAGIAYNNDSTAPFTEQAEVTVGANFWGTVRVCDALFPLLNPHARVVHLSSSVSAMAFKKCSDSLKERLTTCKTEDDVKSLMTEFVQGVKDGTFKDKGWPENAYGASKMGLSAITSIQQATIDNSGKEDVIVNSACPGYVATDMTNFKGHGTVEQGADTPCYLALLPPGTTSPRGAFLRDKTVFEWQSSW